ncbi:MAG: hypothetical protein NVS4B8_01680 [Herpetosiphon sp.]
MRPLERMLDRRFADNGPFVQAGSTLVAAESSGHAQMAHLLQTRYTQAMSKAGNIPPGVAHPPTLSFDGVNSYDKLAR